MTILPNTMRKDNAHVVRRIWSEFETWAQERRTHLERECEKVDAKWRATSTWSRPKGNNESQKAKELRAAQEQYISSVREEWHKRLMAHKLKDEDWGLMTQEEQGRVFVVLGGDLDDSPAPVEIAAPRQPQPVPAPSIPAPAPAPVKVPLPHPAPLSPAARTFNSSTSSYSFVDPADFTTDDELYDAVSSYITVVSSSSFCEAQHVLTSPFEFSPPMNPRVMNPSP
jgi:hypothetical protein